jgi:hypothetical protein
MKIEFSVDLHDKDGDVYDNCIVLHLGDMTMVKIKDIKELEQIIIDLGDIRTELVNDYGL